jgi:hypothetical protein
MYASRISALSLQNRLPIIFGSDEYPLAASHNPEEELPGRPRGGLDNFMLPSRRLNPGSRDLCGQLENQISSRNPELGLQFRRFSITRQLVTHAPAKFVRP